MPNGEDHIHPRKCKPQRVRTANCLGVVDRLDRLGVALDHPLRIAFEERHPFVPLVHVVRVLTQHHR
jgi:hypothetical protein